MSENRPTRNHGSYLECGNADAEEKKREVGLASKSNSDAKETDNGGNAENNGVTKDVIQDSNFKSEEQLLHQENDSRIKSEPAVIEDLEDGINAKNTPVGEGNDKLGEISEDSSEEQPAPKEQSQQTESDSDDFGSFSDASIEGDEIQDNSADIATYLERILPLNDSIPKESAHGASPQLESLIQEERPRVIYEQLVLLRIVLKPFLWEKSCIKSNLWHILRIPEKTSAKPSQVERESLNDTLFTTLCSMLHDDTIRSQAVLRDQFGFMYTPFLTPVFLQEEDEKKREEDVPGLLAQSPDKVDDLQLYHDKLCQSIDLLLGRLQELQRQEYDLIKDKTTFENVVTNLTGHTQRLYRDEVALYNKHKHKKKNRFSWVGH